MSESLHFYKDLKQGCKGYVKYERVDEKSEMFYDSSVDI